MAEKFRVGITRDVLGPSGEPVYGREALRVLDDPLVEWEYLPAVAPELTPEHASRYDALCVFGARVSRKTVTGPDRRLKLVARDLGAVRDLDVLIQAGEAYAGRQSPAETRAFAPLVLSWRRPT